MIKRNNKVVKKGEKTRASLNMTSFNIFRFIIPLTVKLFNWAVIVTILT